MSDNRPLCFLELTDFSYRVAVCSGRQQPIKIEQLHEFPLTEIERLAQLLPPDSELICALRAKTRQAHLASNAEATQFTGLAGLQAFAQSPGRASAEPAWFAGVQASDGQAPGAKPWLLSLSPETAHQQSRALVENLKAKSTRYLDATIITAGTLKSLVTAPTLLLEIGELASQAFLVSPKGVLATHVATLNLDQIAEAVQAELNLKFRGSAAKLFFNPDCDFSDNAAKIADRLAIALQADLAPLLKGQPAPTALCCSGLPAAQHWLGAHLATSLGLTPFIPTIKSGTPDSGLTFATPKAGEKLSPAWFTFLNLIKAQSTAAKEAPAWQAEWISVKAPVAVTTTVPATKLPHVETTSLPATKSVEAKTTPTPAAPAAKNSPSGPAPITKTAPSSSLTYPPAKGTTTPKKSPANEPTAAKPAPATAAAASTPAGKNNKPLLIGAGIALAAIMIIGFFYWQSQNAQAEALRLAQEKQATELRLQDEAAKARLAEQKRQQEAASHKLFEFETNQKLADAEAARLRAENEARQQTAARLASARGNLVIVTEPAGAMVTVGDQPATATPLTLNYLKIGRYPVTIQMPRYDEIKMELEVTENGTTNPGVIALTRIAGALEITSSPTDSRYELQPANAPAFSLAPRLSGQTPATLTDLEPGEYTVTFTRSGWAPHTEKITVARDETARTAWTAPQSQVEITSTPAGATITQNGASLGRTPLTLTLPPGDFRYEVTLSGYDPLVLSGQAEEGKTLNLIARLLKTDRIYGSKELDTAPEPIKPELPDLPDNLKNKAARTDIQLIVNRDGTLKDVQVINTTNPDLAKYYLKTVSKWKFKPGMKAGKPVPSRVMIPFIIKEPIPASGASPAEGN